MRLHEFHDPGREDEDNETHAGVIESWGLNSIRPGNQDLDPGLYRNPHFSRSVDYLLKGMQDATTATLRKFLKGRGLSTAREVLAFGKSNLMAINGIGYKAAELLNKRVEQTTTHTITEKPSDDLLASLYGSPAEMPSSAVVIQPGKVIKDSHIPNIEPLSVYDVLTPECGGANLQQILDSDPEDFKSWLEPGRQTDSVVQSIQDRAMSLHLSFQNLKQIS